MVACSLMFSLLIREKAETKQQSGVSVYISVAKWGLTYGPEKK